MPAVAAPAPLAYRYFFALLPDAVTARRIHAFAERTFGARGLMRPDRLHVTLAITPDFDEPDLDLTTALLRAGAAVAAAPFDLTLDRLSGGQRTVALRPEHSLSPLRALQAGIARAMAEQGAAMRPDWRFNPHLTLVYRDGDNVSQAIEGFSWAVQEFVLIESLVGLTRHEVLGRWPLRAAADPQHVLL